MTVPTASRPLMTANDETVLVATKVRAPRCTGTQGVVTASVTLKGWPRVWSIQSGIISAQLTGIKDKLQRIMYEKKTTKVMLHLRYFLYIFYCSCLGSASDSKITASNKGG